MIPFLTKDHTLLIVRIAFGYRLIHGTIDNIVSWERMLEFEQFLSANGFPMPLVSAVFSVYLQFISGLLWILGYQVKRASLIMILNFLVAIVGFHIVSGDSYIGTAPAIHLLVISILLLVTGPGKYALDQSK